MAVLTTLLMTIHLLVVNVASAGPLVCIWLHERGRRGDVAARCVGRRLATASLWSLVIGIASGFLLLAIAWASADQSYADAVRRFPARQSVYAAAELLFSLVCLVIYVGTWDRWRRRPWLHGLVAVLAATNLLYHFPPLMTVLGELAARPELADEPIIAHAVFRSLMVRPEVLAHVAHFVAASIAVAGVAVMYLARGEDKQEGRQGEGETGRQVDQEVERLIVAGAWTALAATALQLGSGLWLLLELPAGARSGLVGGDWPATGLLLLSLVAVFGLLHALAAVALGDTRHVAVRRAIALLVAVVLLMTATLSRTRQLDRPDWPVGQFGADGRIGQPLRQFADG